ncbi:hypothetical protein PoB_003829700 [Plakobranchus ocellatus]|uniref:Uncharacterized protein n=1 Tax=Plakobranchus ocellatus TaxID=259542 RepID=A0AAV4AXZ1_9GAST|nr:hypothetical protein PoB_003829700 [Plakobranchus ocellatus]
MTSGQQQVYNGRGRHKIGGNGIHLQRAKSYSGWTKPPSSQDTLLEKKTKEKTKRCTEWQPRSGRRVRGRPGARWVDESGKQQVHKGRGRQKIGGNGRNLQRATSFSGWTKSPSNQIKVALSR